MTEEYPDQNQDSLAEATERLAARVASGSWGAFFIWMGVVFLASIESGAALLGIGVITLVAQALRIILGLGLEGFWFVVGLLFLAGGVSEMLDVQLRVVPILLFGLGLALVISVFRGRRLL